MIGTIMSQPSRTENHMKCMTLDTFLSMGNFSCLLIHEVTITIICTKRNVLSLPYTMMYHSQLHFANKTHGNTLKTCSN